MSHIYNFIENFGHAFLSLLDVSDNLSRVCNTPTSHLRRERNIAC